MLTAQSKELLKNLRAGKHDLPMAELLEQLSAHDFIADLRHSYPFLFQEREIGRKYEVGLARFVGKTVPPRSGSGMTNVPVLLNCLLINSYGNCLSSVEAISSIRILPPDSPGDALTVIASAGTKLDKTPEGWVYRQTEKSRLRFSEQFLTERGFKFDVFRNFWAAP